MKQDHRLDRVCDFIGQNLDKPLSLEILSGVAALSKYHFHRIFTAYTGGISVANYILLMRLKRASFRLAFEPEKQIIVIALEAGFESPEAFSRAFKRVFRQSPSEFRNKPDWPLWRSVLELHIPVEESREMDVKIVELEAIPVALIEHKGSADRVLETAGKFIHWRKETGLSPVKTSRTFGVPYSDPNTTPADQFRFDICGSCEQEVPDNAYGVKNGGIAGGRYAVVRHHGSHDDIEEAVYYLYRFWLPESDEELRDLPCFFEYINLIHEVDECDLITDVYLPLQ